MPGRSVADAALPAAPVVPGAPLALFAGRSAEMSSLARHLSAERLVTVSGPGGCGKTRLAIELLRTKPAGPGELPLLGFVELAAIGVGTPLAAAVLAGCGVRDEPARAPLERLIDQWRGQPGLLVVDNCEHVRGDVALVVHQLLRRCPSLRVLATSRVPLGLTGEVVLNLTGLDVSREAVGLFLDRARRVQPELADDELALDAVMEICRITDGLPLAIELAAAHARSLSLDEIRDGVAGWLDPQSPDPATLPQHRSLAACMGWSIALISGDARRALAALSVLGGRFTLDAALAVVGADDGTGRRLIEILVDHSLVQFDARDGRYLQLDFIRAYAARELAADPDVEQVRARLLHWASEMARSVRDPLTRADPLALTQVVRDEAGLQSALQDAVRFGHGLELADGIVADLAFSWSLRGRCAQGRDWAQRVMAAGRSPSCRLSWAGAFLTVYGGEVETGVLLAAQAAEQAAAAGDIATQARALILVGMAQEFADPAGAALVLTTAVGLAEMAGDGWGVVEALQVLGYAHLLRADHRGALDCADRALNTLERLGHDQLRAWDAVIRAEAAVLAGRLAEAAGHGHVGLHLARSVEEPVSAAAALQALVRALAQLGRAAEAVRLVEDARPFFAAHPGLGTSAGVELAGAFAACWDQTPPTPVQLGRVLGPVIAGGIPAVAGQAGLLLAYAELAAGQREPAVAAARAAAEHATTLDNAELGGAANLMLAAADRTSSDAADRVHGVLSDAAALGLHLLVPDALDLAAGLAVDAGRAVAAARLQAASSRLREELGTVCSPLARQFRTADERRVAALLSSDVLAVAHEEGRRLDLHQAVSYASRSRGRRVRPSTGWESLTPTELDVVTLAARGLTNPAIGEQLLIGTGTVRTHLRGVFGKLGVASRSELAALAARRALS